VRGDIKLAPGEENNKLRDMVKQKGFFARIRKKGGNLASSGDTFLKRKISSRWKGRRTPRFPSQMKKPCFK